MLAHVQFYARWRWPTAERAMRRALTIDRDHVLAHCFLGMLLAVLGRDDEARELSRRATEIDPLSPFSWNMCAITAYYLRDYEIASSAAREALELQPDDLFALWLRATSLAHSGDRERGAEFAERLVANAGEAELFLGCAVATFAVCGAKRRAEQAMGRLRRRHAKQRVGPLAFSIAYAALGLEDEALRSLQSAYDEENMAMFYIAREPYLDSVRERTEFRKVLDDLRLSSAFTGRDESRAC